MSRDTPIERFSVLTSGSPFSLIMYDIYPPLIASHGAITSLS